MSDAERRRTILLTGATGGLRRALAAKLVSAGWHVLVHGRNAAALDDLVDQLGDAATPYQADLASMSEVKALAERVVVEHPRLDVLVNNAAVGFGAPGAQREVSEDGFELRFAVNYLVPVLLGWRLTPALAAAGGRIVEVGSIGQAPLDLHDLAFERGYHGIVAYRRAKLALTAYTAAAAPCLAAKKISVACVHPASFMPTAMVLDSGTAPLSTIESGVRAVMRRIEDPEPGTTTGMFFDGMTAAVPHPQSLDPTFRVDLLEVTGRLLAPLAV